ncbi:MAG: chromate transporter [Burkholderiales bacterium]|nr:chromate transporter [Burkholderiales bacterium]
MILSEIALYFALLSLVSVGGIPAVMPEMQRIVVEVQGWMSASTFTGFYALAQAAPGPNVLVCALLGWKVAGITGGLVALAAFCAPAAALAWWIGGLWDRMREASWRTTLQRALVPVTVGFVAAGGYVLAMPEGPDWRGALIASASAAALLGTRVNPLWILGAGGLGGALLYA